MPSNRSGSITYIGARGSSTIDLVWSDLKGLQYIEDFVISNKIIISDHLQCLLTIKLVENTILYDNFINDISVNKTIWEDEKSSTYRNNLELTPTLDTATNALDMYSNIKTEIKNTSEKIGINMT